METLFHSSVDRSPMLTAFLGLVLAYVVLAAVLIGTVLQQEKLARAPQPGAVTEICRTA